MQTSKDFRPSYRFFRKILSERPYFSEVKNLRVSVKLFAIKKLHFEKNIYISRLHSIKRVFRKALKTTSSLSEGFDSPYDFKLALSKSLVCLKEGSFLRFEEFLAKRISTLKRLKTLEIPSRVPIRCMRYISRIKDCTFELRGIDMKVKGGFSLPKPLYKINKQIFGNSFDLSTLLVGNPQRYVTDLSL